MKYSFQEIQEAYDRGDFEELKDLESKRIEELMEWIKEETRYILYKDELLIDIRTAKKYLLTE